MTSPLPAQIQLGEFVFDTEQRQLIHAGAVTLLEPKVFDLLCYFIEHPKRFIPLEELHQQVWAGRVVTDTAVRRTISKLRVALGDTDNEAPRYIKTQMKLGYMFIGELQAVSNAAPADTLLLLPSRKWPYGRYFFLGAGIVLVIAVLVYMLSLRQKATLTVSPLASFPGEKIVLTVSPDGRYFSYNAQSQHDKQWRPFLYDSGNGTLVSLDFGFDYADMFSVTSFDTDNSLIAAHNSIQSRSVSLVFYDNTDINTPRESIRADAFEKMLFVHPIDNGRYLINAQKHHSESTHYYVFEKDSKQFNQLSYSKLDKVDDVDARVSPDGIYAAILRRQTRPEYKLSLQLYRLSDAAFISEWSLPGKVSEVPYIGFSWLSNQQLLLSKDNNLYQLDIKTKELEKLDAHGRLGYIQRDAQGQLYAIQYGEKSTEVTKSRWGAAKDILQRYEIKQRILRQDFAETDTWHWQLFQQDSLYSLQRFEPNTGVRELVIADTEGYWLEAQSAESDLLILRKGFQLRLFDRAENAWRELSQPTQHVSYATFSQDNRYIWFNELVGSDWFINQFDLTSNQQQRLVAGFFKLYQWQQNYIGITEQGEIWLLDQQWSRVRQLPVQFNAQYRHHVAIRADNLLVAHLLQTGHWQFDRYNLASGAITQQVNQSLPVETTYSIDSSGTNMLVSSRFDASHDLVKITLH